MSYLEIWKSDILLEQALSIIYSEHSFKKQFNVSLGTGEEILHKLLKLHPFVFHEENVSYHHTEEGQESIFDHLNCTDEFAENYFSFNDLTDKMKDKSSYDQWGLSANDSKPVFLFLTEWVFSNFVKEELKKNPKLSLCS